MYYSIKAKSEEILVKWRQDGWAERWYKEYGIEPIKRILQEMPADHALEELLKRKIESMRYEDDKLQKVYNEGFWLSQIASMRALREEAERIFALYDPDKEPVR